MKCTLKEWQQKEKPKSEMIVQASDMTGQDQWRLWPIGMSWQYIFHATDSKSFQLGSLQLGSHENLVLSVVRIDTDKRRRPTGMNRELFAKNLARNGIQNQILYPKDYFAALPSYKFIVSPEGNGIDCHRHYEALMAGCIPILERNPLTEEKYKDCPILWTTDYSEITPPYLEKVYKEMLDKTYDFSCLYLSHYDVKTQDYIKSSSDYWLSSVARRTWYK